MALHDLMKKYKVEDYGVLPAEKAFDIAVSVLGPDYKEIAPWVYLSLSSNIVVRATDSDLEGHKGNNKQNGHTSSSPHINIETFGGRVNYHVLLEKGNGRKTLRRLRNELLRGPGK